MYEGIACQSGETRYVSYRETCNQPITGDEVGDSFGSNIDMREIELVHVVVENKIYVLDAFINEMS